METNEALRQAAQAVLVQSWDIIEQAYAYCDDVDGRTSAFQEAINDLRDALHVNEEVAPWYDINEGF